MLGIVFGDWVVDLMGFGYLGVVFIFGLFFVLVGVFYLWLRVFCVFFFWLVFIFMWFLGVVVGDFLDKLVDYGGLVLSCYIVFFVLLGGIGICIFVFLY